MPVLNASGDIAVSCHLANMRREPSVFQRLACAEVLSFLNGAHRAALGLLGNEAPGGFHGAVICEATRCTQRYRLPQFGSAGNSASWDADLAERTPIFRD